MSKSLTVLFVGILLFPSLASAATKPQLEKQIEELKIQMTDLQAALDSIYKTHPELRKAKNSTEDALKELKIMTVEADRLKCYEPKGKSRATKNAVYKNCSSLKKDFDKKYRPVFDNPENWTCIVSSCSMSTFLGDQRLLQYVGLKKIQGRNK